MWLDEIGLRKNLTKAARLCIYSMGNTYWETLSLIDQLKRYKKKSSYRKENDQVIYEINRWTYQYNLNVDRYRNNQWEKIEDH